MKKLFYWVTFFTLAFLLFTAQSDKKEGNTTGIDPRITRPIPTGEITEPPVTREVATGTSKTYYYSPSGINSVNPSYRPFPSTATESECEAYSNPNLSGRIFVGWNAYGYLATAGIGWAYTDNTGANWSGSNSLGTLYSNSGDPSVIINGSGHLFMNTIGNLIRTNTTSKSTDNGVSWNPYTITYTTGYIADKNHITIDDKSTSPYYNYIYVGFSDFTTETSPPPIRMCRSTDNTATWITQQVTAPLPNYFSQGVNIQTGPNGEVYFINATSQNSSPGTEKFICFGKSNDGGMNYNSIDEQKIPINGIRGFLKTTNIRVNSFPWMAVDKTGGLNNGNIYITWCQIGLPPAGNDPDICFAKSTNGGITFSTPVRVNDDPLNNGRDQWFPNICVDAHGGISIVYYDSRNPTTNDSAEVYVAHSGDAGNSFTNVLVSDHRFKPKPIPNFLGGYQGDYIGIAATNDKVFPFWADDFTGVYQVWTAPVDLGPSIEHSPLVSTEQTTGMRPVNAVITPAGSPIVTSLTKLFVSKAPATAFDSIQMTNTGGNNWTANISLSGSGIYKYYIRTVDNLNRPAFAPAGAPQNYYSFFAGTDTIKPVIAHSQLGNIPKPQWPATVSAFVSDNMGIDSVWVKWYKNTIATGIKHFKLNNVSGTIYSNTFNSIMSDVNFRDTIYYKIFAQDAGSNHFKDSTILYSFRISEIAYSCIGTGAISFSIPFSTEYSDSRTDILYLAEEIYSNGGGMGQITGIGFNFLNASTRNMKGFTLKMQNTSSSSIYNFVTSNWTTVFAPPGGYTVPGIGLHYITLTSPFNWNGQNLLVEICFDNDSASNGSNVTASNINNKIISNGFNLPNINGCVDITTATSILTVRPNACFSINLTVGINNQTSNIPETYSLLQNYPNPFNPVTKIDFEIPKQGLVTLKIYDVLGREVTTLVNEMKSAGSYSIDFNASGLSSGIYFYKLTTEAFSETKKMLLIK